MDLDRYTFRILAAAAAALLAAGTVFFHAVEKLSWLDAYYFCVVTLTTVGYGDITPKTPLGKFGATIYILLGVGIIAAFLQATARRREIKRQARVQKRDRDDQE
jgi:voltage-gated potassium channel